MNYHLPFIFLFIIGSQASITLSFSSSFKDDIEFLSNHTTVEILSSPDGLAKVAVCPEYQGRIITSTAGGDQGISFGWINRDLIASGENNRHFNAFGGEDRFWLGPEGGQFSLYFAPQDPFDLAHWFTPPPINEEPFHVVKQTATSLTLEKEMRLQNYSRAFFELLVQREIKLLETQDITSLLQTALPEDIQYVAFESDNRITNIGSAPWRKETGLLSIWILGMFNPSDGTTIVIPYQPGPEDELGPLINDRYFGKVPEDRLVIAERTIYFKGDGKHRSKIGLTQQRALPVLGSYDSANGVLTLVQYSIPGEPRDYVNSMWEIQDNPYSGDAINSYNDGPPEPGKKPLGPFYELETSSPAAALSEQESLAHQHRTFHFTGARESLDRIAQTTLGVGLDEIESIF
ncbi:hypothetical protein GF406_24375 [candidate division KSB1 bacterium]|nr:hypothetical protein [candidate division KSB1 bacterium]